MDADNTLIIPGLPFPGEGLRRLKNMVVTSISTGSGIVSLEGKMKRATSDTEHIDTYFSGPIITENGARILKSRYYVGGLAFDDVIYEKSLDAEEIETVISLSKSTEQYCDFFAF